MGEAKRPARERTTKKKTKPPVFHIPIGHYRQNGEVVMAEDVPIDQWMEIIMAHPATLAAGACVIIGPNTRSHTGGDPLPHNKEETAC